MTLGTQGELADTHPGKSDYSLADRFTVTDGTIYLTAMQALVRVLIDQHRSDASQGLHTAGYISGYPGSPLGGVDLEMHRQQALLTEHDIIHQPGLNEDLAATAVWGTQTIGTLPDPKFDGVFGMWFGKSPGVDRSGDALRHGNIGGVAEHGGVLVLAGDDPDARSTNFPTDTIGSFYDWSMPILFPGNVQDIIDLGRHGYALSRASGLWVAFKMVTDVADGAGSAIVSPDRIRPVIPTIEYDGKPFRPHIRVGTPGPPMREAERDLLDARTRLAAAYIRVNQLNPVVIDSADASLGFIAAGKAYYDLRQALDQIGLDEAELNRLSIRVKKVSALSPVEADEWREFADGLTEIIVVEEKRPFIERFLKEALYGRPNPPLIIGKRDERGDAFLPMHGEFNADLLARTIGGHLQTRWHLDITPVRTPRALPMLVPSTMRTPYFCSGCPHNRSLVVPEGSIVASGIGCHILQLVVPRKEYGQLAGFTQMGAEGAQWIGAAPFSGASHIYQNLGDGTFHHSGSLALRYAVATNTNITYKLLYNSAVGMTGGQDVEGALSVPDLTRLLEAEGVKRIIITTDEPKKYRRVRLSAISSVRHRDDIIEAQSELAAIRGVTVLINDQQCAAEKRRLRKRAKQAEPTRRIMINSRVCEGCGDCNSKSQCLSVQPLETEFGRKTTIHQSSCNLDYSCANGDCPSFLSVETKNAKKASVLQLPTITLTEPTAIVPTDAFNIHMVGIGGTGVVTISQILANAAVLDGRVVRDLDLTGSSQKAGPVVSQLQIYKPGEITASAIGDGEADLYLAFDLLGATTSLNLAKASTERTVVVGSSTRTPTGQMAFDSSIPYPDIEVLQGELGRTSRAESNFYLDAESIAKAAFGTHMVSNAVLIGAAYQLGALPIARAAIEEAITLNGVAVEQNLGAFAWGRVAIADPAQVATLLAKHARPADVVDDTRAVELLKSLLVTDELARRLRVRVSDLIAYQNESYARRYVAEVRSALLAEQACAPESEAFTRAVADGLHHFMAYKDEYEVARLHLLPSANDAVREQFGPGAVVSWQLHPPILRAMGMKRKISLGPWFRPGFATLRAMKSVRGTKLDVFGYAEVRRVERALVTQYVALMGSAASALRADNLERMAELAATPDMVRGYEHVKLRNVRAYLDRVEALAAEVGIEAHTTALRAQLGTEVASH